MKLLYFVCGAVLLSKAASNFAPESQLSHDVDVAVAIKDSHNSTRNLTAISGDPEPDNETDNDTDDETDDETRQKEGLERTKKWNKAMCSGQKLFLAMANPATQTTRFIVPLHSSWYGTLFNELRAWGYKEFPMIEKDYMCDFEHYENLKTAFTALKIDTRSDRQGGDNICYHVEHNDSPIREKDPGVAEPPKNKQTYIGPDGKRYRATSAYSTIGVNPESGVLFFIHRMSALEAARSTWTDRPRDEDFEYIDDVKPEELPLFRATSDIAWGFWNRAHNQDITNIKFIMSTTIINDDTQDIINRALKEWVPPKGQQKVTEVPPWPGVTFNLHGDNEGLALLGSPNGLAAGFFLAQHKTQLGEKLISKITVFRSDTATSLPNLLFWVKDAFESDDDEEKDDPEKIDTDLEMVDAKVKRGRDGGVVIKEHVFRARL
ncbi:hypothetical protein FB567DRAFT_607027 [Paraphoma chrysanthemicola]|uniref:Uncharacterized protein n=1 Tax=Paraphoma chrysanthemicola TaxID=798071 RepID=A0A8K0VV58_9PLEO|nr:hypothetical protein FB567DRAFT_607027 [Paraphoma chrysanthemicola]